MQLRGLSSRRGVAGSEQERRKATSHTGCFGEGKSLSLAAPSTKIKAQSSDGLQRLRDTRLSRRTRQCGDLPRGLGRFVVKRGPSEAPTQTTYHQRFPAFPPPQAADPPQDTCGLPTERSDSDGAPSSSVQSTCPSPVECVPWSGRESVPCRPFPHSDWELPEGRVCIRPRCHPPKSTDAARWGPQMFSH